MIPILQTELKSLRELYQERVDEINNFEYRVAEIQGQAQREAAALQTKLTLIQDEYESFKRTSRQQQQLQQESAVSSTPATAVIIEPIPSFSEEESAELAEQREVVQQLQQDIQGLHAEIQHLLKEKDVLVQSSTQLEEELHATIMAKEKLTQQVADYKRQVEQIPQLETMLTMTNQQKLQMENQFKKTEAALKNQEKIVETLAKNLQKKEKEYQRLIQQLDATQQQLRKTEESLNNLSNEQVALESTAQGLHRTIEELQECKEVLTKSQEDLQRKVFSLETDLVKSRVDNQNLQDDLQSVTNQKDMLLMALETSQMKLREKIEEVEMIEAQKRMQPTTATAPAATIQHIQQGIVGGVGNIVDYFEQRAAASSSPVPGGNSMDSSSSFHANSSAANHAAAGKPAFPLLKRLSTGISSFAQGQQAQPQHQQQQSSNPASTEADHGHSNSSHALAASIRSKYSHSTAAVATHETNAYLDDDDPSSYAPVPSTRDVDSDDEA